MVPEHDSSRQVAQERAAAVPTGKAHGTRPRLIVAHPDPDYAKSVSHMFRRLGWEVFLLEPGQEAQQRARLLGASAVVLDAGWAGEGSPGNFEKIGSDQPGMKVILVATSAGDNHLSRSSATPISLVRPCDGMQALIDAVYGPGWAVAG